MNLQDRINMCVLYENMNKHKDLVRKLGLVEIPSENNNKPKRIKKEYVDVEKWYVAY